MNKFLLKRIEAYLNSGDIKLGTIESSNAFNDYIVEAYPWGGSHIIWKQVSDIKSIDLQSSNQETIVEFINSSRLGAYSNVAMVYSAFQECLIMTLQFLIENLEFLTSLVVFQCYFVGIRNINDQSELIYEDFIEFEFNRNFLLTGKIQRV